MNIRDKLLYMPKVDDVLMEPATGSYAVVLSLLKSTPTHVKLKWSDIKPPVITPIAKLRTRLITDELMLVRKSDEQD